MQSAPTAQTTSDRSETLLEGGDSQTEVRHIDEGRSDCPHQRAIRNGRGEPRDLRDGSMERLEHRT